MKTVFACLLLLLLLALTPGDHQATAATPGPKGCYDPADYGAKPNDDIDDRVPAQQALDDTSATGGRVCFGAGAWTLTRAPLGSYNRFAALATHGQHVEISGEGPGTVLRIGGDQGGSDTYVISLDPGASDIRLRDFVIDTSGMTNTDEQTHAIAIGTGVCTTANGTCSMPVVDVSVERIRFVHPRLPGAPRKGDCIRLLGNTAATQVLRTKISGNTFTDCARSDVAIQRNVNSLTIIGNHFASPRVDQHIDGEPSGGEGDKRIEIIGNTFDSPSTTQGDYAVAITSYKYAVISGNIFNGRGLSLYGSTDAVVTGNLFDATIEKPHGVIAVGHVADRTVIAHNVIYRRGVAGPGIRVTEHAGGMPSELIITGNSITNETDGVGIAMESPQDVTIADNAIRFPTPTANTMGVHLLANKRAIDGVMIANNRIVGALKAGVQLEASPHPFVDITLTGNQILTGGTGISIVDGKDISVSDNVIESSGTGGVGIHIARLQSTAAVPLVDAIQVRNNHIRGFEDGIQAAGNAGDLTRLVVVGNQTRGSTGAAIRIRPGVPAATVHGNQAAPGETTPLLILESGYIVTAVGFAGNGSPEGVVAAGVGSLYTRLDADPALPRLWVKETGTDARGWRQVATVPPPLPNPISP